MVLVELLEKVYPFDVNIGAFVQTSLGIGFERCWWTLEEKLRQIGIRMASQIDANFERPFFQKTLFLLLEKQ